MAAINPQDRSLSAATRALAGSFLAATLLCAVPAVACGQTLDGRVIEDGRDVPVAGAAVFLLDREGARRAEVLSDSVGRFRITPPEAGEYYVEAVRLGFADTRSPLFAMEVEGTVPFDIMMTPTAIGIAGLEVFVERQADEFLRQLGQTPASLGKRWITRQDIEAMPLPPGPREVIRWRNIPGLWVDEGTGSTFDSLCVIFRRANTGVGMERCALILLDGSTLPLDAAQALDAQDIEAMAILDPLDATTFYGTQGGGGAVLIWTRRGR